MSEEVEQQDPETLDKIKAMLDDSIEEQQTKAKATKPKAKQKTEKPRKETAKNTTYDDTNATQGALYAWSMMTPALGSVTVTDMEKSMYIKAVLNDVPVILPIDLEMGDDIRGNIVVELRTLSNYEADVVFLALELDKEEGIIKGSHQLASRIQQYAGALQTLKVQEKALPTIAFPSPGDSLGDRDKLRSFVKKHIGAMSWPRWQAILNALRIFETKLKICNDAALNGNFWKPRGADS